MKYRLPHTGSWDRAGYILILVIQRSNRGYTETLTAVVLASQQSLVEILSVGKTSGRCTRCLRLWMQQCASITSSK